MRQYHLIYKTHSIDDEGQKIQVFLDSTLLHFLIFLLTTGIFRDQPYYLLFVALFLPVTFLIGMNLLRASKKSLLARLMNESIVDER